MEKRITSELKVVIKWGERKAPGTPNMKKKCDDEGDTPGTTAAKKERIDRSKAPAKTSSQTNYPKTVGTRNRQSTNQRSGNKALRRAPPITHTAGERRRVGKAEAATSESPEAHPKALGEFPASVPNRHR